MTLEVHQFQRRQPSPGRAADLPDVLLPEGGKVRQKLTVQYDEDIRPTRERKALLTHAWPSVRTAAGNAWALLVIVVAGCLAVVVIVAAVKLVGALNGIDLSGGG